MKVEIKFPFIESFADYHEIEHKGQDLRTYHDTDVAEEEIGLGNDGAYYGVFYLKSQKPSEEELSELIAASGYKEVE
jgi:hypothetical protein